MNSAPFSQPDAPPDPARKRVSVLPPAFRRNFTLGALNGILFNISTGFISTNLVLPGLVRALGGSHVMVGTLPALDVGGWLLPQLIVGTHLQSRPRKLPLYWISAGLRAILFGGLVLIVAMASHLLPTITLVAFFLCYGLYTLASGLAGIPFQEVVAKAIPPRRRGIFFGLRQFGGGLLTIFLVSWIVGEVLREGSPWGFPQNYALLFGLAFACALLGLLTFSMVLEPPSKEVGQRAPLRAQFRLLPALWRSHPDLRRFLAYKVLARLGMIAEPFYIVFVTEQMGVPIGFVRNYLIAISVVQVFSYLAWSQLSDRLGNRLLLRLGSGLAAAAPPLALLLPLLGTSLGLSVQANAYLFALVFVLSGLGNAGQGIGMVNYVLELLPERHRPGGLGLINTITGVLGMLTILGGTLADLVGYSPLFLVAAGLALASFLLSWPLGEPRRGHAYHT